MTRPLRRRTGAGAIGGQDLARPPRRAPFVALVGVVLLGALTCLLMLNTLSAADELEQQSIADSNAVTRAQAQQLQVDLAAREAPAALARAAGGLGMVPADQPAFLRINPDGSVTLLGVPGVVSPPPIALLPPSAGGAAPASAAATPTATPTGTASTTPTPPAAKPSTTPKPTTTPTAKSTPTATSTPTPAATVTLPGGAR